MKNKGADQIAQKGLPIVIRLQQSQVFCVKAHLKRHLVLLTIIATEVIFRQD